MVSILDARVTDMSLRLSGDAGGDSTRAESFLRNPLCESEIRVIPTNPRNIHLHPNSSTSDFFPQSFREKLKIIILNSSDPKRSLGYLRARFAEFSRTRPSKGCAAPSAEKAQITPALDGAISGVLIHGGRKSSDGPGAEAQVTLPLDVSDAPLGTPPQVTGVLIQGERESSDEPDAESRAISSPEVIAPFHSRFPFDSPPVDSVNPMLEQEDTQLEKAVDRGMKSQSMLPNSQRFYAGSNHRIKKRQKIAINQDSPKSSTLPLLFQFLSLLSHRCPSPVHKAGEAAKLTMENSSVQAGGGSSNSNAAPNKMRMIGVDGREGQGATTTQASPFQRLKGKMAMMETATEKEKKILVWNISKNKPILRIRLMAVGVYLSIMAITSKTLLDGMKRIWQIRGHIDTMQLPDRRFVIEFSELGDFEHVVKGGPWNFRNDVVLIEELKEGIDAESFTFSTIPIWVQFQKIPFYLLSQQLVKDLGNEVGELVTFDKYARGDICDKILRARVRIPIDQALQRWVTFRDEYEQQNVTTCLAYERLPNFCCSCGIFGHLVTQCRAPDKEKMVLYDVGIGAPPTLPEDPRRWPIPEFTGQARQLHTFPWRSNRGRDGWLTRTGNRQQLPTIAQVAKDVGKLTVNDPQESNAKEAAPTLTNTSPTTLASSPLRQEITIANTNKDGEAAPPVGVAVLEKPPPLQGEIAKNVIGKGAATTTMPPSTPCLPVSAKTVAMTTSTQAREEKTLVVYTARKPTTWKRTIKVAVQDNNTKSTALTTQGGALGAPRTRPEIEEGDAQLQPRNKRIVLQVPNMEQCLGVEGLKKLLEEEMGTRQPEIKQYSGGAETGSSSYQIILNDPEVQPKKKDKEANNEENSEDEATSTPKAGQLTGAKERARQKK